MPTMNVFDMADTWNAGATTFTAIKMNVTDTASAAGSLLIDLQLGGVSYTKLDKTGKFYPSNTSVFFQTSGAGAQRLIVGTAAQNNFMFQFNDAPYQLKMASNIGLGWTNTPDAAATADTVVLRDAANTLALRNGTIGQALRVYGSYTDGLNGDYLEFIKSPGGVARIRAQALGTGSNTYLYLNDRWQIDGPAGHFLTIADNTYDIGASAGTSPKDIYASGLLVAKRGTATPAGGVQAVRLGTTTTLGIFYGSGAPSATAGKGSLYLRSDGSGIADRAYINTDGGTTWTALTTMA
jgi:hypothetical protein